MLLVSQNSLDFGILLRYNKCNTWDHYKFVTGRHQNFNKKIVLFDIKWTTSYSNTHCGGKESTCLELFKGHGAYVSPKEKNKGY